MEWHLNIPKILHVYWGGGPMYYLRYMTIKSFMKHNPDWEVNFYYPKFSNTNVTWHTQENDPIILCDDFLPEVMKLPINKIEIDFKDYGFENDIPEVHKSDFIRLIQLGKFGGLWSDMDILYFKPMSSLYFNTRENNYIDTFYCNHLYGHSIGFMMGSQGNRFFATLAELAKTQYNPNYYQTMGTLLYNQYFPTLESINKLTPAMNIDMEVVYAHNASNIADIVSSSYAKFTEKSIGFHWYGGAPQWKKFAIETNGGQTNLKDNVIGNLLKDQS